MQMSDVVKEQNCTVKLFRDEKECGAKNMMKFHRSMHCSVNSEDRPADLTGRSDAVYPTRGRTSSHESLNSGIFGSEIIWHTH